MDIVIGDYRDRRSPDSIGYRDRGTRFSDNIPIVPIILVVKFPGLILKIDPLNSPPLQKIERFDGAWWVILLFDSVTVFDRLLLKFTPPLGF